MDSILARLTALEPAPAGNLVPNPYPHAFIGDTDPGYESWLTLAEVGWTVTGLPEGYYYAQNGYGLPPVAPWPDAYCLETGYPYSYPADSNADFTVYPVPAGTGGCPVTPGATYTATVSEAISRYVNGTARLGVVWSDASGTTISTDQDDPQTLDGSYWASFWYGGEDQGSDYAEGLDMTWTTPAAPTGAAFARPFVQSSIFIPGGRYYTGQIAGLTFTAAA